MKCNLSHVMCHVTSSSSFLFPFFDNVVKLVGEGSFINGATASKLLNNNNFIEIFSFPMSCFSY